MQQTVKTVIDSLELIRLQEHYLVFQKQLVSLIALIEILLILVPLISFFMKAVNRYVVIHEVSVMLF